MIRVLLVIALTGCTTTTETRSLVCFGFCSEQSIKRESASSDQMKYNQPKLKKE